MEKYSELSYRELQCKAKELGIAANKKREVLLELIVASESSNILVGESIQMDEHQAIEQLDIVVEAVEAPLLSNVEEQVDDAVDLSVEYFDSYPEEADEEEEGDYHECDTGDLIEAFEDLQLKGIPNPTGIKIVFDAETTSTSEEKKIDWGINFEEENSENVDTNTVRTFPVPSGKHTVFSSPELAMGKATHWTYEDFDKKPEEAEVRVSSNTMTPGKNKGDRMSFWLAKGPKTPGGSQMPPKTPIR